MIITVTKGIGYGKTLLSSFDAALNTAGVANYNIIPLSSIIPVGSEIKIAKYKTQENEFGHRLYVVKAEKRSDHAGKAVGAGIGWYQLEDGSGLFVEHEIEGQSMRIVDAVLKTDITNSLIDLCKTRNIQFHPRRLQMQIISAHVKNSPTCALVMAVYRADEW